MGVRGTARDRVPEHGDVQAGQVALQVDGGDRAVVDGEVERDARTPAVVPDQAGLPVDEGGAHGPGAPREEAGDRFGTTDLGPGAYLDRDLVGAHHDIRVEHGEQRVEVAVA